MIHWLFLDDYAIELHFCLSRFFSSFVAYQTDKNSFVCLTTNHKLPFTDNDKHDFWFSNDNDDFFIEAFKLFANIVWAEIQWNERFLMLTMMMSDCNVHSKKAQQQSTTIQQHMNLEMKLKIDFFHHLKKF